MYSSGLQMEDDIYICSVGGAAGVGGILGNRQMSSSVANFLIHGGQGITVIWLTVYIRHKMKNAYGQCLKRSGKELNFIKSHASSITNYWLGNKPSPCCYCTKNNTINNKKIILSQTTNNVIITNNNINKHHRHTHTCRIEYEKRKKGTLWPDKWPANTFNKVEN